MVKKLNCWEFKKCGREPGGKNSHQLGVCPASTDTTFDKTNRGINAGRICWAAAGTLCIGEIQGTFAQKISTCYLCDFFKIVFEEEKKEADFKLLTYKS